MHKTPIFAHRGASGYAPENTLAAFKLALKLEADAIECDVQVCKSGEVMVFHDRRLKRITGAGGKIKHKKLSQLLALDAGNGERIPTLKETLDMLDARITMNVELKEKRSAVPAAQVLRNSIRTGHWKTNNFIVSSFYFRELRRFHEVFPEIPVSLLYNKRPKNLKRRVRLLKPLALHLNAEKVKQK